MNLQMEKCSVAKEKGKTMSDYIKREDAMKTLADEYDECEFKRYAEGLFKDIPSADVVPVVRCKDCKCWTEWANGTGSCNRFTLDWIGTDADDFCSIGERKDDE